MYATRAICGAIGTSVRSTVSVIDSFCGGAVNSCGVCSEQMVGGVVSDIEVGYYAVDR